MNSYLRYGVPALTIGMIVFAIFLIPHHVEAAIVQVGGSLSGNTTWTADNVYVVGSDLVIPENISLSIQPGTVVKLKGRISIFVRGALIANGQAGTPIVFTSFQDDTYGGDTDGDGAATPPKPGDWGSVQFDPTSNDTTSSVQQAIVRYGGLEHFGCCDDAWRGGITLYDATPSLTAITFEHNFVNGVGIPGGHKTPSATVASETWKNIGMVYVVLSDLVIDEGFSLIINPGIIVKFTGWRTSIFVNGSFDARGTAAAPIIFTSFNDDAAAGDTDNDGTQTPPSSQDWGFLQFEDSSNDSASFIHYATIRYSGLERFGCCDDTRRGAINLANAQPDFANLTFTNNYLNAVGILGGTKTASATVSSETWKNTGMVYILLWDVTIDDGFTLTIAPGMIIKAGPRTSLFVHGVLDARGTADQPIIFTSLNDDTAGGDTDNDAANTPPDKSDWGYVEFEDSSKDTQSFVEFATFRYSGLERFGCCDDTYRAALTLVNAQPKIANLTFSTNYISAVGIAGGTKTADERWDNPSVVYVVLWDVAIDPGAKLIIGPGMIIKFTYRSSLFIKGALDARGTANAPIIFTSLQDDTAGGDSDSDGLLTPPKKRDWGWIQIEDNSTDATTFIENATFRYSGLERFGCCDDPISAAMRIINAQPTLTNISFAENEINGAGIEGGERTSNERWSSTTVTYVVLNDVTVPQGLNVTIDPGVIIKFRPRISIFIKGSFSASGTATTPITFTSLNDDSVGGDSDADGATTPPAASDWGWIDFADSSDDATSVIAYAILRYAGLERFGCCDDTYAAVIVLNNASPRIDKALLTNNYQGIYLNTVAAPNLGCNDIYGNQKLGIFNKTPDTVVSATGQWWGNTTGPTHKDNPSGTGQSVGDAIGYAPWATQSCLQAPPPPPSNFVYLPLVQK